MKLLKYRWYNYILNRRRELKYKITNWLVKYLELGFSIEPFLDNKAGKEYDNLVLKLRVKNGSELDLCHTIWLHDAKMDRKIEKRVNTEKRNRLFFRIK